MLWRVFARRYMFSPKSHSVINIIASVSILSVAVPTAALIIFLAMFAGLERTIGQIYSAVDADIEIVPSRGQTFESQSIDFEALLNIEGVEAVAPYLEQNVMASSAGRRTTLTLRGVDTCYRHVLDIEEYITQGHLGVIFSGDIVLGSIAASSIGVYGMGTEIELYALNRKQISTLLPTGGISRLTTHLGGVLYANSDIDATLAIGELGRVQRLLNHAGRVSGVAIRLDDNADVASVERAIESTLDEGLTARTRQEKSSSTQAILEMERLAIILIGALIALVATFSIVGAVIMLITEKQRDIATLRALGASHKLVQRIFVGEGLLLTLLGVALGAILGIGLALGQEHFGWVKIPGNNIIESYPVDLNGGDVALVVAIIAITGWVVAELTVRAKLKKRE